MLSGHATSVLNARHNPGEWQMEVGEYGSGIIIGASSASGAFTKPATLTLTEYWLAEMTEFTQYSMLCIKRFEDRPARFDSAALHSAKLFVYAYTVKVWVNSKNSALAHLQHRAAPGRIARALLLQDARRARGRVRRRGLLARPRTAQRKHQNDVWRCQRKRLSQLVFGAIARCMRHA